MFNSKLLVDQRVLYMDSMAKKMGDFIWKKTMGANYRTHNQTNSLGSLKSPKNRGIQILTQHLFPQWEFQDPKMEVLYHIKPYELWGYSLT